MVPTVSVVTVIPESPAPAVGSFIGGTLAVVGAVFADLDPRAVAGPLRAPPTVADPGGRPRRPVLGFGVAGVRVSSNLQEIYSITNSIQSKNISILMSNVVKISART